MGEPLGRLFGRAVSALNAVGAAWVLALAALVCADICGRAFFNAPIVGVPETVQFSLVGIVYLQLADAARGGRLIRSEAFLATAGVRWPKVAATLGIAIDILAAALFGYLAYSIFPEIAEAWERNYFLGNRASGFTLPVWPIKLIITVGAGFAAAQLLELALRRAAEALWARTPGDGESAA